MANFSHDGPDKSAVGERGRIRDETGGLPPENTQVSALGINQHLIHGAWEHCQNRCLMGRPPDSNKQSDSNYS